MKKTWSLDSLYLSLDDPKLDADYTIYKQLLTTLEEKLKNLNTKAPTKGLQEFFTEYNKVLVMLDRFSYVHLFHTTDTTNQKAVNWMEKLESLDPQFTQVLVTLQEKLCEIENLQELIKEPELQDYAFFIQEQVESSKYNFDKATEAIVGQFKLTGSSAWGKLQDQLISTLTVPVEQDGETKELPLAAARNLAFSPDKNVRKKAYEAELESYKKIAMSSAACLNAIKGEVITDCDKRGYASPLDATLLHSRMDRETLDALIGAIEDSLPIFQSYLKKKADLLGYEKGLPFYELFAPMGSSDLTFSYEEAMDFIVSNFHTFSDKLGNFADGAFKNQWIDAEPREGKVGGAFCANLTGLGESRILANFGGSLSQAITLAHELGHGYHGDCLRGELPLNTSYPMPLAETASIFCETIVRNAALSTYEGDERLCILEEYLQTATQIIVDIYSRYVFETELFNRRKEGSLSVDELCEIMKNAQLKAYGDGLDPDCLHPYMWICKPHYYSGHLSFYNFPYAFGLLFAVGLYAQYEDKGDLFVEQYDDLLAATGKNNIYDVVKIMNIDVHEKDFFLNGIKTIEKDVNSFLAL